jgi:hypothetical protein
LEKSIYSLKIAFVTLESFKACFVIPFLFCPSQLQDAFASRDKTLSQLRMTTLAVEAPPIVRMNRTFRNTMKKLSVKSICHLFAKQCFSYSN